MMTKLKRISTTTKSSSPCRAERIAIALGGNLSTQGPVEEHFRRALVVLAEILGPLTVASLYRSAAVSDIPQPDYLNTVLVAMSDGRKWPEPHELLALAKRLESEAGRVHGPRWGPRPLDVDLLVYGDRVIESEDLVIPHPRLAERRFVLAPLAEIAPDLAVPPEGRRVADLLARLPRNSPGEVVLVGPPIAPEPSAEPQAFGLS